MADSDKTPGIVEAASSDQLTHSDVSQTVSVEGQGDVSEEDILSQALVDVSEFTEGVQIHYSDEGVGLQEGNMITSNTDGVTFITSDSIDQVSGNQLSEHFVNGTYQVLTAEQSVVGEEYSDEMNEEIPLTNGSQVGEDTEGTLGFQKIENGTLMCTVQSADIAETAEEIKPVMSVSQSTAVAINNAAPLGSSQNPIRIIQQGNQYTPVQQLSTDQLQQIMQVVQQQQVTTSLESGSSVLFNPQTNTRIVYRVIYPSELHKDSVAVSNSMQTVTDMQSTPRKVYKKRNKEEDSESRDGPSLTKEEKEVRKKARSKTRSGRVSKPPKHMVKDFKHIHVLDYDEDYDDSDGGYSDYKVEESDGDEEKSRKDDNEPYIVPGLNSIKPKNWKCITCEKAYIGRAGLGRHLKLNPTHGSIDLEGDGDMIPPPPGTDIIMNGTSSTPDNMSNVSNSNDTPNGIGTANSTASLSEDSRDSSYSLPYTPTPTPTRPRGTNPRGRPRGRGWRGRGTYGKVDPEIRRRNKLKDLVKECTDEELMEIVLPRLAKVITLWEFLLMKVEKGNPAKPHADDVYTEYEKLHHSVKKLCQEYLQFIPEADVQDNTKVLQVDNIAVAEALGLKTGAHKVKEISDTDASVTYKYKFLTTNHSVDFDYTNRSILKRTVEVVSPEQIVSPTKRFKNGPVKLSGSPETTSVLTDVKQTALPVTSQSASSQPTVLIQSSIGDASQIPVSNSNSPKIVSANLLTNSKNLQSNISHPKVVSLLSNSLLKRGGTVPIQPKTQQPSQKFIIVSGMNSSPDIAAGIGHQPQSITFDGNQPTVVSKAGEPTYILSTMPPLDQKIDNTASSKNVAASNKIILQTGFGDNVPIESPLVPQSSVLSSTTGDNIQHMYFTVPLSSQNSILSSNMETDTKSPIVTEISNQTESNEINSIVAQDPENPTGMVSTEDGLDSEFNETSAMLTDDIPEKEPDKADEMLTSQDGEFTDVNDSQGPVSFTVDSDSVLQERKSPSELHEAIVTEDQDIKTEISVMDSTNASVDIIGVNSIDTSETNIKLQEDGTLNMENDAQLETEYTDVKTVYDTRETSVDDKLEPPQGGELYQYEENTGETEQVETIQIPATNIFQTEDGAIFIQNQDGTFIQLQSADGQNVSMETVQALLANEGDAQLLGQDDGCQLEQA